MIVVEKVWGKETWIVNISLYCCKLLDIKKGFVCSYHKHDIKDEMFYVLSGVVMMNHDGDEFFMEKDSSPLRIKPGEYHSFLGIHNSRMIEISTQHFEDDSYRKDKSRELDDIEYVKNLNKFYKHCKEVRNG